MDYFNFSLKINNFGYLFQDIINISIDGTNFYGWYKKNIIYALKTLLKDFKI